MKTVQEIKDTLAQCYGTSGYHRWSPLFRRHVLTDGVKTLCEMAECYWLADAIASYHGTCRKDAALYDMQFWNLKKNDNGGATLTCSRDKGDVAITQEIECTDFPLDEIDIWVSRGDETTWVLMLTSEY